MAIVVDERIGGAILRIETQGGGFRGALIRKGSPVTPQEDDDLTALHARLRNEAGKLHPDYVGMDGAIARFLTFFQELSDPVFRANERSYKEEAARKLSAAVTLDRARQTSTDEAIAVRKAFNTNVLSRFELARLHALLGSEQGPAFVRAAARFTDGDLSGGLAGMVAAIAPHGRHSWPMLTYLPSLWRPDEHMFLKPLATIDYAQRIGHRFQYDYSAEAVPAVYESLLDLFTTTRRALERLAPAADLDGIGVQSFIWVVGSYTDADRPTLDALRRSL